MKKLFGSIMVLSFLFGIVFVCFAGDLGPTVSVGTPIVKMAGKKTAPLVIMGTGFKPGQEINVLFVSPNNIQTDIGYSLKPEPKPDATGSWGTTWVDCARFVDRKLVNPKGGAHKIVVSDSDYIPIVHTSVFFQAPEDEKK